MTVPKDANKRRAGGAIRVPFVRRCDLDFGDDSSGDAFIVNINVLGAYGRSSASSRCRVARARSGSPASWPGPTLLRSTRSTASRPALAWLSGT